MASQAAARAGAGPRAGDARNAALLFALALLLHVGSGVWVAARAPLRLPALAAFFDGYLYLEIAKSFPLPYAPAGVDYTSHAPGYPALVYAAHGVLTPLLPAALPAWGMAALAASWLPAALAAVAFHALARELGLRPLLPTLAFLLLNPRWLQVAATPNAEPAAMLFALLSALATRRGRGAAAAAWLAAAGLTRFPALLLGAALAFATLAPGRGRTPGRVAWLALPPAAFAALVLYLHWRIPGYAGIAATHGVFWEKTFSWPFATLAGNALRALRGEALPAAGLTYGSLLFYGVCLAWALRGREPGSRWLAIWIGAALLPPILLSGDWGGFDFARLVILAWPAAVLVAWRRLGGRLPSAAALALCGLGGALAVALSVSTLAEAVRWQGSHQVYPGQALRSLRSDEPRWLDIRGAESRAAPPPAASRPLP